MILTALYAALTWLALITLAIIGISLYAKIRDQRKADGVNWSMTA